MAANTLPLPARISMETRLTASYSGDGQDEHFRKMIAYVANRPWRFKLALESSWSGYVTLSMDCLTLFPVIRPHVTLTWKHVLTDDEFFRLQARLIRKPLKPIMRNSALGFRV